jgi:hypothetical protein
MVMPSEAATSMFTVFTPTTRGITVLPVGETTPFTETTEVLSEALAVSSVDVCDDGTEAAYWVTPG